jgi:transposase-like protein
MDTWIPTVLEKEGANLNTSQDYSECICPHCKKTTVHHIGAPCQHYTCPECGAAKLERRGEHEKPITETKNTLLRSERIINEIVNIVESDGNSVANITKEKIQQTLTQYLTEDSKVIKQSELLDGNLQGPLVVVSPEGTEQLLDSYLTQICSEDYLQTFKKAGQKVKKFVTSPRKMRPTMALHRAYWSTKPGQKIPWPRRKSVGTGKYNVGTSQTVSDIAAAIH